MKKTLLILFYYVLIFTLNVKGQSLSNEFAYGASTPLGANDFGKQVKTDALNNIYILCDYSQILDLDPSYLGQLNFYNLSGNNNLIFAKYAPSGTLIWAKEIQGKGMKVGVSLELDALSNIYIGGTFSDSIDLDPSINTNYITTQGGSDFFISKYDNGGNFLSEMHFGTSLTDLLIDVKISSSGMLYLLGSTIGSIDLDPTSSTNIITNSPFIAKYNSTSLLQFAQKVAATPSALSTKANGQLVISGSFFNTVDFDPGASTINATSLGNSDAYVLKYDTNGNYMNHLQLGGSSADKINAVTIDNAGNLLITGKFTGIVDFDPSSTIYNLGSGSIGRGVIAKYSNSNSFLWAALVSSKSVSESLDIQTDVLNNVYSCGTFIDTTDFDPSTVVNQTVGKGGKEAFILKLNNLGVFQWVKVFSGGNDETCNKIQIDNSTNIVSIGTFLDTTDFTYPSNTTSRISHALNSFFSTKMNSNGILQSIIASDDINGGGTIGKIIKTDHQNNVVTAGLMIGKVDFNFGSDTVFLSAKAKATQNIYFNKYAPNGNLIWANVLQCKRNSVINDLKLDTLGNIYIAGRTFDSIDLDPGIGVFNVGGASSSSQYSFLAKYSSNGTFLWGFMLQSSTLLNLSIDITSNGDLALLCWYSGSVDFDPTASAAIHTMTSGSWAIAMYDAQGNYKWTKTCETAISSTYYLLTTTRPNLRVDSNKNIYVVFSHPINLDYDLSATGVNILASNPSSAYNTYLAKYDSVGNFIWVKSINSGSVYNWDFEISGSKIITAGTLVSASDFDMSGGTFIQTPTGGSDFYIAIYDLNGNLQTAKGIGGANNQQVSKIAVSKDKKIATFLYNSTNQYDLDPSSNIANYCTGATGTNVVFAIYDSSLNYITSVDLCNADINWDGDIAINNNMLYATGYFGSLSPIPFNKSVNFNPTGTPAILQSINTAHMFFAKYNVSAVLPITLELFRVFKQNNEAIIEWKTSSELNNIGFEIERSRDGIHFEKLKFVSSLGSEGGIYSSIDEQPYPEMNYYRIRQIDMDGNSSVSEIKSLYFFLDNVVYVTPNPIKQSFTCNGLKPNSNIKIYSLEGKLVFNIENVKNETSIAIPNLASGNYILSVRTNQNLYFNKLIQINN